MFTSTISTRCFAVLLVAACGSGSAPHSPEPGDETGTDPDAGPGLDGSAGGPDTSVPPDTGAPADAATPPDTSGSADAGVPPGAPSRPLERFDWRTARGAPVATTTTTVPTAELFALSGNGFVTRSECQDGCTLTWRNLAGVASTQRARMSPVTVTSISPDGRRALLVALDRTEICDDGQLATQVARGVLQLLDLATGVPSFQLKLRSNTWSALGFTPSSDWFFTAPIAGNACIADTTGLRSASSPFAAPPGLAAGDEFVQMIDARRWVVIRPNADVGYADPLMPNSFQLLENDPSRWDVTRGWLHVYHGFADLAEDVLSIPPSGPMLQTALHDQDWHPFGALGPWVRVCRVLQPGGFRDCRVVDARAATPPADFRATFAPDHADDTVLLAGGAVVFVGPLDDGNRAVQRIQLATGRHEILHPGNGTLRSLGDGTAALLVQDGSAWLIDADREELVATRVSNVISVPQLPLQGRLPGRQDDVAMLVQSTEIGPRSLAILDVRTRRLATVTDSLFFVPPRGLPFSLNDTCGQPWTTRNAGGVVEGLLQAPQQLFFVELGVEGRPATIWVLPIDLSAPPRRLAELTGAPTACHAPLASPDGRRIGFAENGVNGQTTRITLSAD